MFSLNELRNAETNLVYGHVAPLIESTDFTPSFYLAGTKSVINFEENWHQGTANKAGRLFVKAFQNNDELIAQTKNVYYGLTTEQGRRQSVYMPSFKIEKPEDIGSLDLEVVKIPSHTYAVFKYIGAHRAEDITIATLSKLLEFIGYWMTSYNRVVVDKYIFEKIDGKLQTNHYCEAHIYIPIGD